MRVFFSAGEASGDEYAAELARRVKVLLPQAQIEGVGGPRLRATGANLIVDSGKWGAIGLVESLAMVPRVLRSCLRAKSELLSGKSGVFVPIDFGWVNTRLAKRARRRGWRVLYFIPPGSWRRDKQGKDLPLVTDGIVTPFEWSATLLRAMGADARWYGHPMLQIVRDRTPRTGRRAGVAVLPGSRVQEIRENLPVIAGAVNREPALTAVEFGVAPTVDREILEREWRALAPDRRDVFTAGETLSVLARAESAIVCSGTATLQAALCETPHVIIYRVAKTAEIEAKLVGFKLGLVGLPNIFLGRMAVPELIQSSATPDAIRSELEKLCQGGRPREAQLQAFSEIVQMMGPADCLDKTAEWIVEMSRLG